MRGVEEVSGGAASTSEITEIAAEIEETEEVTEISPQAETLEPAFTEMPEEIQRTSEATAELLPDELTETAPQRETVEPAFINATDEIAAPTEAISITIEPTEITATMPPTEAPSETSLPSATPEPTLTSSPSDTPRPTRTLRPTMPPTEVAENVSMSDGPPSQTIDFEGEAIEGVPPGLQADHDELNGVQVNYGQVDGQLYFSAQALEETGGMALRVARSERGQVFHYVQYELMFSSNIRGAGGTLETGMGAPDVGGTNLPLPARLYYPHKDSIVSR